MNKELPTVRPACRVTVRISPSIGSMAGIFWGVLIVSLSESGLLVKRIPYFWAYTVFEEAGFCHHGRVSFAYPLRVPAWARTFPPN
jgi:hypothetical protein